MGECYVGECHERHALELSSPIGQLQLVAKGGYLVELNWEGQHREISPISPNSPQVLATAASELERYFTGAPADFTVPLTPEGTDFQIQVWTELQHIPWGSICSYREIAERIGKPNGSRAVGTAIGRNPLPLLIPCHRVIGSNGSLTGFSGGLEIKKRLLGWESRPAELL